MSRLRTQFSFTTTIWPRGSSDRHIPNSNEDKPIKFSTSKASHRTWKVSSSMGIQHQRPLWKVLPIILVGTATILWCFLREETDIDAKLEKQLHEHLSGLLSDSKEDED
uniref:Uncharacterized protein n=1 Tax=Nothobranchius furzeri TaxID=105023 RepID=A0A8C6PK79_NOTFU